MKPTSIAYLIKIGKKYHIDSLRNKGLVYLNTIKHFKEVEGNDERRDEHEGADRIAQVNYLKIKGEDGKEYEFFKDSGKMGLTSAQFRSFNQELKGNLYCMIGISPEAELVDERLDERNKELGDTILLIREPIVFLERLSNEIQRMGLKHYMGFVAYYNEKVYQGNLNQFNKTDKYKHQNEFRVFIEYEKDEPLVLNIGSLREISEIYPIKMFSRIRFKPY
jgi:hypothetical protein